MATILAVDDRQVNREFLVSLLGSQNHNMLEASDGAEALALVKAHKPDLVITDILMPTMDGYEFVRQLRADRAIAATAVVFFTAHYHKNEAESLARSCGVGHILTKPCEPELILRIVEELLCAQPSLSMQSLPPDFDHRHLRVITDELSQTADELRMSNRRLGELVDINLKIASERDHQELLNNVCPAARNLLGAKYAALAAISRDWDSDVYFVTSGMDAATVSNMGPAGLRDGVTGSTFADRTPRRLRNPRAAGLPQRYPPVHSMLVAPIVSPAHSYGWICLTDKIGADEFSAEDEHLLSTLAAQVGRIYENGRLYGDIQRYATRLEAEIDRRTRAQEALIESDGRFRELAETIRDVFFLIDAGSNRTLYISPAYAEIWGRSCESAYANPDSWTDVIHPEDRAATSESHKTGKLGGKPHYEYRIVRPDGSIRWIEARIFPIRSDDGRIVRIAGVATDITERKLAAHELQERDRRFSDLLDNVELVSMMLDTSARITYCNDYLLKLTGWRREDVLGQDWFRLFVPPEAQDVKGVFAALIAEMPNARHHENEILTSSGQRRLIRWNNSLLRSGAGQVIGAASIGEDITEQKRNLESLRQNEERTRLILESVGEGIHGIDRDGKIIFENSAAAKLLGYPIEELSGMPAHATIHHSRKDGAPSPVSTCAIHATMHDGKIRRVEDEVFWRKDGSSFPVEYTTAPMRDDKSEITGAVVAFRDITGRLEAENRIGRLNRVYAVLSGINTLIVRVRDRETLFREACRTAVEAGAFKMAWIGVIDPQTLGGRIVAWHGGEAGYIEKIRLTARDGTPDSEWPVNRALRLSKPVLCNDIATETFSGEFRADLLQRGCRSAGCFPLTMSGQPVAVIALFAGEPHAFDEEETRLLLELCGDISFALDHIEKEEKLNYLAYYDELTGLANRNLFLERVAQYLRIADGGGEQLAVGLIDLERFKNINHSLGRPAGDELLRQVAVWLTHRVGDTNLLARVDADHFAMVLPKIKHAGEVAGIIEAAMEALVQHPFSLGGNVFRIAAKTGVALYPDDGADADTLFKNADAALRKAKVGGDRCLFYARRMSETAAGHLNLENQLRDALDKQEFVLHYQPKVNLTSGKLTGAEALLRWNDPRTGLVPPGRFIPVLEQTGLIHEVGRWTLRKAIADYLHWCNAGLSAMRIAVNVSQLQLRNRSFIAEISESIGIDPRAAAGLELEITESVVMGDVEHSIDMLQSIRAMNISIAIDDFGTGFSSLSYLSKLPVDSLKIDRSFVVDMTAAPEGLALVSTIINLAHSMKLKVVAEGVETEEQSRLLRSLGCDEIQGYLIGKPVPRETFERIYLAPSPAG